MLLKGAERIAAIQARLDAASPGPWQRSRFVDGPQHRGRSAEWKADADRRERESVVRGRGQLGSPDCNVVLVFARVKPEDMELIVHAPQDLSALLAEVRQANNLILLMSENLATARKERDEARAQRDALRLKLTSGQVLVNALDVTPRTALPKLQAWARGESVRTDSVFLLLNAMGLFEQDDAGNWLPLPALTQALMGMHDASWCPRCEAFPEEILTVFPGRCSRCRTVVIPQAWVSVGEVPDPEDADAPLTAEDHAAAEPFKQRLVDAGLFRRDSEGRLVPALPTPPPSPLMTRPCPHGLMWPECVACRPATDTEGEDDEFADAVVHLARMFTGATPDELQAIRELAADAQEEEPS